MHLLAVAQACLELEARPGDDAALRRELARSKARIDPLRAASERPLPAGTLAALLDDADPLASLAANLPDATRRLDDARAELRTWLPEGTGSIAEGPLSRLAWAIEDWLSTLRSARRDLDGIDNAKARLGAVAATCQRLAREADFGFLYNRKRHLFHIGFRVVEHQLDAGFYDLLASEARATSLRAIAKGDVPAAHWAALGRPLFACGDLAGLRSWSGSMFEYLMPPLVLDEPHGSLLHSASRTAVEEQIAFGRRHRVPWGISESAYAGSDHTLAYQYAPQGVPALALRRTPVDELVVAPYATAIAAQVAPHRAAANLRRLEAAQARGRYGFIEALDFTPARQSGNEGVARVETFMAHHQGMSVVALANVLLDRAPRRWGMGDARIEAVATLLHERAPREVPRLHETPASSPPTTLRKRGPGVLRDVLPGMAAIEPTHLLSNGRYAVSLRANGAGTSRWGRDTVSRSRDDALRDAFGTFFHLRWDRQPRAVSLTQHPAPDRAAHYHASFHGDRAWFGAVWSEVEAETTVWVSPEDDIEFRRVVLRNNGDRMLDLELISSFEVSLADARADEAHPAFQNLFVSAEWQARHQALVFERKPRLATDKGVLATHFIAEAEPALTELRLQVDRQRWLGRNRGASHPLAAFDEPPVAPDGRRERAARHRPRSGGRVRHPTADRARRPGPGHLLHRRRRQPLDAARSDRQVPPAKPRRARLDDVGDPRRHPPARHADRRRDLRRHPDPHHAAGDDADAAACAARRGERGLRPAPALALRHLRRPADRPRLRRRRPGLRPAALAGPGAAPLVMGRRRLRLRRHQPRAGVVPDAARPADRLAARGARRRLQRPALRRRDRLLHRSPPSDLHGDELSTLRALARVRLNADGRPLAHHVQELVEEHDRALEDRQAVSTASLPADMGAEIVPRPPPGEFAPDQRRVPLRCLGADPADAPLGQRARQSGLRRADQRGRRRLQLGPEQPAQHADAVVERPGRRPARRVVPAPGHADDAGLERRPFGRRRQERRVPGRARPGLQHHRPSQRLARRQRLLVRRPRRGGEAGAAAPHQPRPPDDQPAGSSASPSGSSAPTGPTAAPP